MLIVRDLLIGPKRFTDLLRGLIGIPTNVLTARLQELEESGIVRRRALPRPERAVVYELTDNGRELEEAVDALGRWGAKTMGDPRPGEALTVESMITALRATFQPAAGTGGPITYELRMGDVVLHARVHNGKLVVAAGPLGDADLAIAAGPGIRLLFSGEVTPQEATDRGIVSIRGPESLLDRFAQTFHIGSTPTPIA